jgi:type IV pilus assembly protein PilY1
VNDTFRAAMAGRGDFLAATDVDRLAQGVANIFTKIAEKPGAATALTGRSATIDTGDRVFLASFVTNRWSGRVDSFDAIEWTRALSSGNAEPALLASSKLPAPGVRSQTIFTSTDRLNAGVTFDWNNLLAPQKADLNNNPAIVDYLRGSPAQEVQTLGNTQAFRTRLNGEILGDIVNSNPLYSKAADARYNLARKPAAANDPNAGTTYREHVKLNQAFRPASIFVGANDGMLHAFDATTLTERFAYVPRAMYPELPKLTSQTYAHRYYVDGPVVEGDVFLNGSWRTVIVGTSGAGPKSVYALDVSSGPQWHRKRSARVK